MLDARRLRVLCAVADHPSLSAAADALSYTPSAVSQQIIALEREAGMRLLHRGPRGASLTEAGRVLVEHARPVLAGLRAAQDSLEALAGLRAGRLQLASFATAGATIVPQAIAAFRTAFPDVTLTLTQADPGDAMVRLRAGSVDLILTVDARADDGVQVIGLGQDQLRAVLPADHRLAAVQRVALADLATEIWVDAASTSEARRLLLRACSAAGFIPRVAFESDEYATVQELVATGAGVALVPDLALRASPPGVVVRELEGPPVVRHVQAAVHAPEFRSPAAEAMLAILGVVAAERFGATAVA